MLKKLFSKIKDGSLRSMLRELFWVLRSSREYKWEILWYTVLGLVGIAMSLGAGILSKHIIDAVTGFDSSAILPAAVCYLAMQLLRIGMNAMASHINASIRVRSEQRLRSRVFDKIMTADWESVSAFHSGDLLSRVEGDVSAVSASILGWLPDLTTRLTQFVGTFCVILYYDPTLALLALLSAPVTVLMSGFVMKKLREHTKTMRAVSAKALSFNEESFQNIQSIKAFGLTGQYSRRLRDVQNEYKDARLRYSRFHVTTTAVLGLAGTAVSIACFGWSVYRLWSGHITYGTMTLFLQLAGTLAASFGALSKMVPEMINAATCAGRIMTLFDLPDEDHSGAEEARNFAEKAKTVTVRGENLSYAYAGGENVLENVSFTANPGEIVAIIGPSGQGKTTLLRLLLGIIAPKEGSLTLDSGDLSLSVSPGTRPLFAYVPQNSTVFSGTVASNLRMLNENATDEELWSALEQAQAADFVRELPKGLYSPVGEQGNGFSQGQIQRLMLARALLSNAPVLLLDEATSALDAQTEERVLRAITQESRRRTCILTTHRQSLLPMCHKIYRIEGKNIEQIQ